jgi:chromosome segregation ATPase
LLELDISSREDRHLHEPCQREAEELQEYIFDLEQRMARVDAEVESKVQAATQDLQEQIELRCSEHLAVIESLREELTQARDSLKKMERETRLKSEKWNRQEAKIKHRETEVCKLYEGLSQEWQI